MKTPAIKVKFALFIITLLFLNICFGESTETLTNDKSLNEIRWKVGQITIEEAKIIRQIESLVDRYKDPNCKEKQEILDSMCEIYKEYQTTFLGIVLLNNVMFIERLDILPEPQTITEREFLTFAKLMQDDEPGVLPYLKNIKSLGLKGFLTVWYAEQKGIDNIPQELKLPRKAKVEQFKSQIRTQIKDIPNMGKADFLFNILENWKSPLEYEACFPLILEEYRRDPKPVLDLLKQLLIQHIPQQTPPPYTREHTVYHELCFIALILNDKSLTDIMTTLSNSNNQYVAYQSSMILKWLQKDVKYPLEYEDLKRAYISRF